MDLVLRAALIGLLQGLTEFIPVSSSAHLELAPWIFGWPSGGLLNSLAFDVFLHLGTLVALLAYFGRDWLRLLRAAAASVVERRIGADPERRLAWLLILATVPAAAIGFVGEDLINRLLHGDSDALRLAIAGFVVVGAVALWLADRLGSRRREKGAATYRRPRTAPASTARASCSPRPTPGWSGWPLGPASWRR